MYKIYTLNEQNDNFFIYIKTNKKLVKKKNVFTKPHRLMPWPWQKQRLHFWRRTNPKKKQFGSNSLSLLHPLEGATFKVSLISVVSCGSAQYIFTDESAELRWINPGSHISDFLDQHHVIYSSPWTQHPPNLALKSTNEPNKLPR